MRSWKEISLTYSIKLWMRYRQWDILCANFMHKKYASSSHPAIPSMPRQSSRVCRHMLQVQSLAKGLIGIDVKNASFWFDY
jgi:hypothetical protein